MSAKSADNKASPTVARRPPKLAGKSAAKSPPGMETRGVTNTKTIKTTSSLSEATPSDGTAPRKKPRKLERRGGTTTETREALTLHHPDGTNTTETRSDTHKSVIPSPTPSSAKPAPPKKATGVPGKVAGAATAGVGGVTGTADRLAGGATGAVEGFGSGLMGTVDKGAQKALPSGKWAWIDRLLICWTVADGAIRNGTACAACCGWR